jgi:4-amino-4-deoxy-L-arabinose transferase-like glycosyltransferase
MNRHTALLAILLLYAAGFRLIGLDRPFHDDLEGHGCFYGIQARNYLRFGWTQTHGMPLLNAGQKPDTPVVFYPDHPPAVALLVAAAYGLFGVGEWQTRLPTSIATIVAVWVLYLLLARFATRRIALIAAALFSATPMTLYFGGFPDPIGILLILFVLLATMGYLNFHAQPRLRTFVLLVAAFTLAAMSDWLAFVMVPVFLVHFLGTRPRREWPWIGGFCCAALTLFATIYIYITFATDSDWGWMAPLFTKHSAIGTTASFTVREWFTTAMVINRARHTLPLLIASGIWIVTVGVRIRMPQRGATVARLLIAWGLLHVVIGRVGVYEHDWWWFPLTPGLAVSAALLLDWVLRATDRRRFEHIANGLATLAIILFASWTAVISFNELYPGTTDDPFSTVEMGRAIRIAAPNLNDLALLVGEGWGWEPQWWFYGDRVLRVNVSTVSDFQERVSDESADLTYNFEEEWNATATGLVFPTSGRRDFRDLWIYLRQRYPLVSLPTDLVTKFDVFDLRHPSPNAQGTNGAGDRAPGSR